jgi:hypothetical protein
MGTYPTIQFYSGISLIVLIRIQANERTPTEKFDYVVRHSFTMLQRSNWLGKFRFSGVHRDCLMTSRRFTRIGMDGTIPDELLSFNPRKTGQSDFPSKKGNLEGFRSRPRETIGLKSNQKVQRTNICN